MTREEAIRRMECCRNFLANNYSDMGEPNITAFNMAIKALEQEPCEDAISREQAISAIRNLYPGRPFVKLNLKKWQEKNKKYFECENIIKALPSVTPTHGTCKDCKHWCHFDGYDSQDTCGLIFRTKHSDYYCADFERRE